MGKLKFLISMNVLVLIACIAEFQQDLSSDVSGIKAHHGLAIYMLAELVLRIKELMEASEKVKEAKKEAKG